MATENTEIQNRERTAQLLWTGLILMFFVIQAVIWTIAISVTASDMSHAVVAGYDEQALHWDEVKKIRQDSAKLGWKAELQVDPDGDLFGKRVITIKLVDASDEPIQDAKFDLTAYHRARVAEAQTVELIPTKPGVYTGTVIVRNSGKWQFTGSTTAKGKQFLVEEQLQLDSNRNL